MSAADISLCLPLSPDIFYYAYSVFWNLRIRLMKHKREKGNRQLWIVNCELETANCEL